MEKVKKVEKMVNNSGKRGKKGRKLKGKRGFWGEELNKKLKRKGKFKNPAILPTYTPFVYYKYENYRSSLSLHAGVLSESSIKKYKINEINTRNVDARKRKGNKGANFGSIIPDRRHI